MWQIPGTLIEPDLPRLDLDRLTHSQGSFRQIETHWVLCNQQARDANILQLSKVKGYVCRSLKLSISPAGLNCFSSKVFSNNIPVSEELVSATGQQMFDLKTSDCPFVLNTNVKHQSRQRTPPPVGQRSFCGRVFQKKFSWWMWVCICLCICSWWGNASACDS